MTMSAATLILGTLVVSVTAPPPLENESMNETPMTSRYRNLDSEFQEQKKQLPIYQSDQIRKVAFSVLFSADDAWNGLVFSAGSTLKFDKVLLNIGNGYNPENGIFTAPVSGLYVFSLTSMTGDTRDPASFAIVTEGNTLAVTWGRGKGAANDQGSKTVPVQLNAGNQVWVAQRSGDGIRGDWWTSFSGFLVQAD